MSIRPLLQQTADLAAEHLATADLQAAADALLAASRS